MPPTDAWACVECHEHQVGIGHVQNHVDLGFTLDDRPCVGMECELDPVLERAFADLIQISREDPAVRAAQVLRARPPSKVGLERRDAEVRRELGIGAVAVERRLQLRRIEIFAAAGHRGDADSRRVENAFEDVGRLREVLLQLVPPRLDPMEAELRRHFDACLWMGFQWREHVAAHRPSELVGR